MKDTLKTVISGSYRKHFNQMLEVKTFLEQEGIHVLAPVSHGIVNPGEEFIILDEDPIEDPRTLQDSIFAKIRASSFLVIANIDDYIGKAAVLEMGYAAAMGLQILSVEKVSDPNLAGYCRLMEDVFPRWKNNKEAMAGDRLCLKVN
ncbi:hypothetical protein [Paenibacillus rigui]|uniref:Nucleoside 2-deoxyribosyltransferase n=1 Tax=Paenibacillus rigui TaxID=554312 RepID=A0A229UV18_9BACL|nr:hypothetical protein [Paenibacillus rigui]OXM87234.1 hypothetical protein CF651_06195 [Paenibacillus rigui]